jgi:hypothetical protein
VTFSFLTITKAIVRQRPQTYLEATEAGRRAFEEYRRALQEILDNG